MYFLSKLNDKKATLLNFLQHESSLENLMIYLQHEITATFVSKNNFVQFLDLLR
jgi:hypothetical protein